jgi:hypothetical protein
MTRDRWFDASGVRWSGQALQPIGGWETLSSGAVASTARRIHPWRANDGTPRMVLACDSHIYLFDGGTLTDKTATSFTPVGGGSGGGYGVAAYGDEAYGTARSVGPINRPRPYCWSIDTWGQQALVVASSDGRLLMWDPASSGSLFTVVSGAPTANQAMAVTPERHVLLVGAGGEARRLAWCSREDYTDWNYASTTNTAGYKDLDTSGLLQSIHRVRDGHLLFSDDELWLVRYVGQPYIYGVTGPHAEGVEPMSPGGVVSFSGRAVWMGQEGFWTYDGGSVLPLPCDVQDYVFSRLNRDVARNRVCGSRNALFPEIWWDYPSGTSAENDSYVVWNYAANWWTIGSRARTAASDGSAYTRPLAVGTDGYVYRHETGWLASNATRAGTIYAESGPLTAEGGARTFDVLQGQLDSGSNYNALQLKAYTRLTRDGSETVEGPYTPRTDGWLDMRFGGRDIRLRFQNALDVDWSVGAVLLDTSPAGER